MFDWKIKKGAIVTGSLRNEGDRLRDIGRKSEAAEAYALHLADHPDDFDIWVQRGNCLKDIGAVEAALFAYERAATLNPNDSDVYLQMGHAHKLAGDINLALEAYNRSVNVKPNMQAIREIQNISGYTKDNERILVGNGPCQFFEIDDLFIFLKTHPTITGIQRVQIGLIIAIFDSKNIETQSNFIVWEDTPSGKVIKIIDATKLVSLVRGLTSGLSEYAEVKRMISELEVESVRIEPRRGDLFFVTGAFWHDSLVAGKYVSLKKAGVKVGAFIYDIIPITHPEFCEEGLSRGFLMALGDALRLFDFALAISEFSAAELRRVMKEAALPEIPVSAVPLAHVLTSTRTHTDLDISSEIAELSARPFVLFVSTIEARKNHALVVSAWHSMVKEGLAPPDLVFAGRRGWRVDSLFQSLIESDFLDGRVHVVNGLSDQDIAFLYKNCRFTVFPSFVEGWGLPVGESLVAGRPCVASSNSSISEVGGDFVDYIDPLNISGATEVLRRMCFDDEYVERRAKLIKDKFTPRTWGDFGSDFQEKLRLLSEEVNPDATFEFAPSIDEMQKVEVSDFFRLRVLKDYIKSPHRLLLQENWYSPEDFGVWMRGQMGVLALKTDLAPNEEVVVTLELLAAPWALDAEATVEGLRDIKLLKSEASRKRDWIKIGQKRTVRVCLSVDMDSVLRIVIRLRRPPVQVGADPRCFAIGLKSFVYVARNNLLKRLEAIEAQLLDEQERKS